MLRLRPTEQNAGFTLAELLVAATLLSVVLGSVYAAFSSSINIWRRGESNVQTYQDARTSLGILSRELQNVVAGSEYLFEGIDDELTFYAAVVPLDVEEDAEVHLLQITYRLKKSRGTGGTTLVREEAPVESALPTKPSEDAAPDISLLKLGKAKKFELAEGVRAFHLTYYQEAPDKSSALAGAAAQNTTPQIIEVDEQKLGDGLPRGVRIDLTLADDAAEEGETTFTQLVVFSTPSPPRKSSLAEAKTPKEAS